MPTSILDSQTPFVLELAAPAEVNSGGQVVITPEALVGPGVTPEAVAQAQATADAAQSDATQALADASIVWVPVVFSHNAGGVSPTSVQVPALVTGTLAELMATSTGQPNGNVTFACTIGGVSVTGGSVSILTTDAGGVVKASTATAANSVTLGTTSVLVTATTASTSALRIMLVLGFRRA